VTCFWGAESPLAAVHAGSSLALRQSHQANSLISGFFPSCFFYVRGVVRVIAAAGAGKTESIGERTGPPGRPTNVTKGMARSIFKRDMPAQKKCGNQTPVMNLKPLSRPSREHTRQWYGVRC
jgi:hypothetical protein